MHRLMRGVMYWRLSASFKARLWNERRSVKELEADLKETQRRSVLVRQARDSIPSNNGAYAGRVAAIRARIDQMQERLGAASQKQNRYLQALAIRELEGQKLRISTYQIQARYELAAIYDRAANDKPSDKPKDKP
jgi:predicted  nucleic acid-binding Zn-ribbon protein